MLWIKYPAYADRKKGLTWEEYVEAKLVKITATGGIIPSENICGGFVVYIDNPDTGKQVKVGFDRTESGAKSLLRSKLIEHSKYGNQL
jgi:hypothetical protein